MAEAEMKSIASIRLQEKYNCVRAYESIGAPMEEFCKDWTKTTGKMLNVKLKKDKLSKWVQASRSPYGARKRPRVEPIPDDEDAMEE